MNKYKGSSDPTIRDLARVTCEEAEGAEAEENPELIAELQRRIDEEPDIPLGPHPGTWAATARLMAGPNPTAEEAEFWDRWKDEMKEGG